MCGIAGFSGQFEHSQLARAVDAIRHRGPDGDGFHFVDDARIGIGHVRLSILDPSPMGAQPMLSEDGSVALCYNGEIYNHLELRAELEARGHRFRGGSDSETLLHLYLEYGTDILHRLNGIFAFAVWDSRERTLLLVRDRMGIKPLYLYEGGRGVAFSSEIKGLLQLAPEARELDPVALHYYLSFLWCPGERTPLKDVHKVDPGGALLISEGAVQRRWCWATMPASAVDTLPMTEAEAVSGTRENLRRAVQRQMLSDVPLGAFLSGGLDSSAIVAFAREHQPDIRCFTIAINGGQDSGIAEDLPYAQNVAAHLNVPLETVSIDATDMAGDIEMLVAQLDEPLADPAPLNVLYISRLARRNGIKVLLSGAGGDDLFTGYRRHHAIALDRYWQLLPASVRSDFERIVARLDQRNGIKRKLSRFLSHGGESGDARIIGFMRWAREEQLLALYRPSFRDEVVSGFHPDPMQQMLASLPDHALPLRRMLALDQRFFLADHNLLYTDKMSMAAGVEARVPFLDDNLIDFANSIPLHLKQRGKHGKWVLKKAMESYLPAEVIYRPKSGFGAPLRRWMRNELRELVGDLLSSDSLRRRGVFDAGAVHDLMAANDSGRVDASYTLFALLSIEIWCRAYIDSAQPKTA